MTRKYSTADQAGILVAGRIAASLAEALILLAIVRLLGKSDVGRLSALLLIYQTIALVMTAGFPAALMYALPARSVQQRKALAIRFLRIMLLLGAAAGLILLSVGWLDGMNPDLLAGLRTRVAQPADAACMSGECPDGVSLRYLMLLAIFPLADIPARILPNLLIIEGRARAAAGVGIIKSLGMSVATVLPLALGTDLWGVVAAVDAFGLMYGLMLLGFVRSCYGDVEAGAAEMGVREIFRFAIPLGLTDLMAIVNNRVDRYLILLSMSAAVFAEYQVGAWQIPFVVTIPFAVGAAYAPRYRALFEQRRFREGIETWRTSIRKVSLIAVPITVVFIVAAEETVTLLFGSDYARSAIIFRLYALFTLGRVASFGSVIVAAGRPDYVLWAAMFSLLSNLLLSLPLLLWIGFSGPALGTALAFVPTVAIYCYFIAKACNVRLTQTFPLRSYLATVVVATIAAVPAWYAKVALHLPAATMLCLIGFVILAGFLGLGWVLRLVQAEDLRYLGRWLRLMPGSAKKRSTPAPP